MPRERRWPRPGSRGGAPSRRMICMAIPHLDSTSASSWLDGAHVEESVWALRPDYVAVLMVATGLTPGPSDAASEAVLREAEASARAMVGDGLPEAVGHVAAWREAYRGFGAKPQRTRSSVEALLRRVGDGLPRIDRLTDAYNAVSIANATPLGGEDLEAYAGPLRLVRASGDEDFEVMSGGARASEPPEAGGSRLARRPRGDLPPVELAAVRADPADRVEHVRGVHLRCVGRGAGGRRGPGRHRAGGPGGRVGKSEPVRGPHHPDVAKVRRGSVRAHEVR
jgi:hypothetical protein